MILPTMTVEIAAARDRVFSFMTNPEHVKQWQPDVVDGHYVKRPKTKEDNWVWTPQHVVNMHAPERWGYVQFSTAEPGKATFKPDETGPARQLLHRI